MINNNITFIQLSVSSFFILFCVAAFAGENIDFRLCGTWINSEYTQGVQKLIILPDGSYSGYTKSNYDKAYVEGDCKIVEQWSDHHGNIWYKSIFIEEDGERNFCLMKESNSGKTIEYSYDSKNFPKLLNAEIYSYRKFFRQ